MTKTNKINKALKFEQALSKLEKIIEKLETESLPLDDSLEIFEEGMELSKICEQKLNEAEGKVEMLTKSGIKSIEVESEIESEETTLD